MTNYWIVQARLHLLAMKAREGAYPVVSWERKDVRPALPMPKHGWMLRLCQHCNDTFRTWWVHPDAPVSCNICGIMPPGRSAPR